MLKTRTPATAGGFPKSMFMRQRWVAVLWLRIFREEGCFRQLAQKGEVVDMSSWKATDARVGLNKFLVIQFPLAKLN